MLTVIKVAAGTEGDIEVFSVIQLIRHLPVENGEHGDEGGKDGGVDKAGYYNGSFMFFDFVGQ